MLHLAASRKGAGLHKRGNILPRNYVDYLRQLRHVAWPSHGNNAICVKSIIELTMHAFEQKTKAKTRSRKEVKNRNRRAQIGSKWCEMEEGTLGAMKSENWQVVKKNWLSKVVAEKAHNYQSKEEEEEYGKPDNRLQTIECYAPEETETLSSSSDGQNNCP